MCLSLRAYYLTLALIEQILNQSFLYVKKVISLPPDSGKKNDCPLNLFPELLSNVQKRENFAHPSKNLKHIYAPSSTMLLSPKGEG
jgi:hypothetical protein